MELVTSPIGQVHFNSKLGVLVEVNSETDFVALNLVWKGL